MRRILLTFTFSFFKSRDYFNQNREKQFFDLIINFKFTHTHTHKHLDSVTAIHFWFVSILFLTIKLFQIWSIVHSIELAKTYIAGNSMWKTCLYLKIQLNYKKIGVKNEGNVLMLPLRCWIYLNMVLKVRERKKAKWQPSARISTTFILTA